MHVCLSKADIPTHTYLTCKPLTQAVEFGTSEGAEMTQNSYITRRILVSPILISLTDSAFLDPVRNRNRIPAARCIAIGMEYARPSAVGRGGRSG